MGNEQEALPPGTLAIGEVHPGAHIAMEYIRNFLMKDLDLFIFREAMASCAIEGNQLAEICSETLRRLLEKEPVSDRYLMGLAWFMYDYNKMRRNRKKKK